MCVCVCSIFSYTNRSPDIYPPGPPANIARGRQIDEEALQTPVQDGSGSCAGSALRR